MQWRTATRASLLEALRRDVPVRIRAKPAALADEHRAGLLVAFELPCRPAPRNVRELATAWVEERRAVPRPVARAVEGGFTLEPIVSGLRRLHHEVGVVTVHEQHGPVQLRERRDVRNRKRRRGLRIEAGDA